MLEPTAFSFTIEESNMLPRRLLITPVAATVAAAAVAAPADWLAMVGMSFTK